MSALLRPAMMIATISIMMPVNASAKLSLAWAATIFSIMKSAAASVLLLLHANLSLKLSSKLHANASQIDPTSLLRSKVFLATGAPPSKLMSCSLPTTGS